MKTNISIFILLVLILISCERECHLTPIPKAVFDLGKIEKKIMVTSGNEIDSLILVDKIEDYIKTSFKGPMNVRDCEHYKSYKFSFKTDDIDVSVRKYVEDTLQLDVLSFGICDNSDDRTIPEKELSLNKEYIFERKENCDTSIIKRIVLKGYLIQSITTSDNKTWTVK
ncbi:hypothetical protein ASE21_05290 [Flavobacterium sp. Root901]|uniref:hypothetical protein n=1 Tax=Flavobacterium sp. Root901 TaxID=1736605 RepID=UPI000713839B|nr:hypothetical protein [Flavobacterium sp. Root901]KRD11131.1 hypothetical protein ASE21_05290 [Flavobacterium sp. Root901]